MRLALCLLPILALLPAAFAKDPPDPAEALLSAWGARLRAAKGLSVRFTQTKHLAILRAPRKSHGLALIKDRRLRMEMRDAEGRPECTLLVAPGEARIWYPRQALVEVYPLSKDAASPAPFPLLEGDVERLPRTHRLRREADRGLERVTLEPLDRASPVASLQLWFRDGQLVALEQREKRGDRVRIEIAEFTLDPPLPDGPLDLVLPPGTRVVRPLGK